MELKTKIYTIFTALLIFRFSPLSQAQAFNCRDLVGGGAVVTVAGMVMLTLDMMEKYNSYQSKPTLSAFDRCEIDCYCKKYVKHKIFGTRYLCTELCNDEDALLEFINPVYWPILSGDLEEFHKIANFEKFNPQEDQFILEHSGRSVPKKVMQKYHSVHLLKKVNPLGISLLHVASLLGRTEMINFLIQKGADKHARDAEGLTPLHYAITGEQRGPIKTLLEAGASPSIKSYYEESPLDLANEIDNDLFNFLNDIIHKLENEFNGEELTNSGKN